MEADLQSLFDNVAKVLIGKEQTLTETLVCLLCGGHLLIDDIPGMGKTVLAKAISRSLDADYRRIQFTPDLMPADVTGSLIYDQKSHDFRFREGPVFTHILLADEINRASPRTQSSLLECMEERHVSVDGKARSLPDFFFVVATQNPVESAGTFPLPEAQLDRFFMRIRLGYLSPSEEVAVLKAQTETHPLDALKPVMRLDNMVKQQNRVRSVHMEDSLLLYIAQLVKATREHPQVQLGASPRGTLALRRAAQAYALLHEQKYVTPDHIKQLAIPVLAHRLVIKPQAQLTGAQAEDVVRQVLNDVAVPIT